MATSATDSASKKEDENARERAVSGDGRTDTVESRPESWKGEQEREPTFHRGMERKELSGQNYQGRKRERRRDGGRERMGEREIERATRETRWRRRSGGACPHFCLKLRKGTEKEGRKDVVKIYRAREKGRREKPNGKCNQRKGGGEGADIFHRKLSRYRSSWG